MRVESSPLTRRVSAIFSVYDDGPREQFLLGANRTALDLYVRRRADDARVVNPPLRFEGVLAGVTGGDTLVLEVRRVGDAMRCSRSPNRAHIVPWLHRGCRMGALAGYRGSALRHAPGLVRRSVAVHFAGANGVLGYARTVRALLGGIGALGAVCALTPMACGLTASPLTEWLGAALGRIALWRCPIRGWCVGPTVCFVIVLLSCSSLSFGGLIQQIVRSQPFLAATLSRRTNFSANANI